MGIISDYFQRHPTEILNFACCLAKATRLQHPFSEFMKYKYIGHWGASLLSDMRIKISHPKEFNDPFEFQPQIRQTCSEEDINRKLADKAFVERLRKYTIKAGDVESAAMFDAWLADGKVHAMMRRKYNDYKLSPQHFAELAGKQFGVTCFSKWRDNILLWSYYADRHHGMVIGFDDEAFGDIYEVDYSSQRMEYRPIFTADEPAKIIAVLKRKSSVWASEGEFRLLVPWDLCTEDQGLQFLHFRAEDVREVILGCKADEKTQDSITTIVRSKYPHALFAKMKTDDDLFALRCENITE